MSELSNELKLKLQKDAGIPHMPTDLTYECRMALSGEGPRAYAWSDKPHRLVFDLCRHIEEEAALRQSRMSVGAVKGCATEGCENQCVTYFEAGGVGSYYCDWCLAKVKALTPASAEGEAVGWYGPFGWLNGHRGLSEDSWSLEMDPLGNNEEYFAVPLYAKVDPFLEIGRGPSTPTEGMVENDGLEECGNYSRTDPVRKVNTSPVQGEVITPQMRAVASDLGDGYGLSADQILMLWLPLLKAAQEPGE